MRRVKDQESQRAIFYVSRITGGVRPNSEVGQTDLANVDEHALSAVAHLGKIFGGEVYRHDDSDDDDLSQSGEGEGGGDSS